MFNPKIIIQPGAIWIGVITLGVVIATTVKVLTRNHIPRKEAYKTFETKERSDERYDTLGEKIDDLGKHIGVRLEDIKCIIEKNGRR